MRKFAMAAVALALTVPTSAPARADLIGSSVTGEMLINGGTTNYFDPSVGFVPTSYLNSLANFDSTTVTVSGTATEFGYADTSNQNQIDLGASTIVLTDISHSNSVAIVYQLVDTAFAGMSLATSSDNFPGGTTVSLVGDTLTIDAPTFGDSGVYSVVLTATPQTSSVPEPGPMALAGIGSLVAFGLAALRRRRTA